jgi:hypothetical protein
MKDGRHQQVSGVCLFGGGAALMSDALLGRPGKKLSEVPGPCKTRAARTLLAHTRRVHGPSSDRCSSAGAVGWVGWPVAPQAQSTSGASKPRNGSCRKSQSRLQLQPFHAQTPMTLPSSALDRFWPPADQAALCCELGPIGRADRMTNHGAPSQKNYGV